MSFTKNIKKFNSRNISLSLLFITGLSIIFLLSMTSLTTIASNSVESLSRFAAQISEKSIRAGESFLFTEKTKRKAEEYSNAFDEASDMVNLFAVQLNIAIDNYQYYNFPNSFQLNYTDNIPQKPNAPISGSLKNNLRFLYWGDNNKLPINIQRKIFYISNYFQVIMNIESLKKYHFTSWASFREEKFLIEYSGVRSFKSIYVPFPKKETLNNFFQPKGVTLRHNWSDVYRDITGKLVVSTYNEIINADKRTIGLVGIDVDVNKLLRDILENSSPDENELKNSPSSTKVLTPFTFVINGSNGKLIAFPTKNYASFGLSEQNFQNYDYRQRLETKLDKSKYSDVRKIAKIMRNEKEGCSTIKLKNEEYLIAFSKISCNKNWVIGVVHPVKQLISSIAKTRNKINKHGRKLTFNFILIAIFFSLLAIFLIIKIFNKYVLKPIHVLRKGVFEMGLGNFDSKLAKTGILEIKGLTKSFNKMKNELKTYMKKLEIKIVERKTLEMEIDVAKRIQQSILPHVSTIFQRDEFDLYGELFSSKAIAKGCYDFFYLKKNKIAVLVADISGGAGISAAFYMATLKSTIRDICLQQSQDPAKALTYVNRFLCDEYKVGMYVSLFLAYYDLDTGIIQYGNAGHYAVLQIKRNGEYHKLGSFENPALGSLPNAAYKFGEKVLDVEDTLVFYTNDIVKATSKNGNCYGENRFTSFLLNKKELNSKQICQSLYKDIKLFKNDSNPDDITILIFKRKN